MIESQAMSHLLYLAYFLLGAVLMLPPGYATAQTAESVQTVSADDFSTDDRIIYVTDQWRYSPGDNMEWASPGYEDSGWESISTYLTSFDMAFSEWNGIGWFRLTVEVDSSKVNQPVAVLIEKHFGASEFYLNGSLKFSLGTVSNNKEAMRAFTDFKPRVIVFPHAGENTIAVRYSNHFSDIFLDENGMAGFRFLLGDAGYHFGQKMEATMERTGWQVFFLGCLIVFVLIHVLLFTFYPAEKRNLYFAFFTFFLAILVLSIFNSEVTTSPYESIIYLKTAQVTWILTIIYALRFTYSLYQDKTPVQFWIFLAAGLAIIAGGWNGMPHIFLIREIFVFVAVIEMMRVLFKLILKQKTGVWIIGFGIFCFLVSILYRILINFQFLEGQADYATIFGSGTMILSMSVFLSLDFAATQKRLKHKLIEVKHLSDRALSQEKINKKKEIETKLLEAENERKGRELEEARTLQLSMLPREIPNFSCYDVAVFMETATEVGGDYYDYSHSENNALTLAVGDATGHGMKAGIMVAAVKSYFHMLAGEPDLVKSLHQISEGIRNLDLKMMYMGLTIVRCNRTHTEIASAGMPPLLWYRKAHNKVERITLKGLPLGTNVKYPYQLRRIKPLEGDVLLVMSDGLMELFNKDREILGLDRIAVELKKKSGEASGDIIKHLRSLMLAWSRECKNEDDITLMVIRKNKTET